MKEILLNFSISVTTWKGRQINQAKSAQSQSADVAMIGLWEIDNDL